MCANLPADNGQTTIQSSWQAYGGDEYHRTPQQIHPPGTLISVESLLHSIMARDLPAALDGHGVQASRVPG